MPYAEVNGQRLHVHDTGGEGPPIVFTHDRRHDADMFLPQVEAFGRVWRVVRWDQRGSGRTESDGRPFTVQDSAADLLGLLDHLGIERSVLAGAADGGDVALWAALRSPDRVRGLVLVGTPGDDLGDRLAELDAPALVVHGTADPADPVEHAQALCAALPGCQGVVEVAGAGPAAGLTHPAQVNAGIRRFLEDLPA